MLQRAPQEVWRGSKTEKSGYHQDDHGRRLRERWLFVTEHIYMFPFMSLSSNVSCGLFLLIKTVLSSCLDLLFEGDGKCTNVNNLGESEHTFSWQEESCTTRSLNVWRLFLLWIFGGGVQTWSVPWCSFTNCDNGQIYDPRSDSWLKLSVLHVWYCILHKVSSLSVIEYDVHHVLYILPLGYTPLYSSSSQTEAAALWLHAFSPG